ncbi:MAG: hypothetical protein ACI9HY_003518 [Planctomycetaceae bacterium]|jgi:hypothetical protein
MTQNKTKPLALVVGVGDATGRRCAELGSHYRLDMVARSAKVIDSLAASFEQTSDYPCDVAMNSVGFSILSIDGTLNGSITASGH